MYERMATGLSAEYVEFRPGQDLIAAPRVSASIGAQGLGSNSLAVRRRLRFTSSGLRPQSHFSSFTSSQVRAARTALFISSAHAAWLYFAAGNPIYREWGWRMFSAIDKYCRTQYGFGAHPDVRDVHRQPDDRMESFFLAETLKYLYLLQSPDHDISLDKYVFNTEAHPTRTFTAY